MANIIDRSTIDSAVSGSQLITKGWLGSIITDVEKGWYDDTDDTWPFARFTAAGLTSGLQLGRGGSTALSVLLHSYSQQLHVKETDGVDYADVACGNLVAYGGVDATYSDSNTTGISYVVNITRESTGIPAPTFGTGLSIVLHNSVNVNKGAVGIIGEWTTATSGSEDADLVVKLMDGGAAAAERMRLASDGVLTVSGTGHFVGTSLLLGTTPATTGRIRIPNTAPIKSRDNGNTADVELLQLDANDDLLLGEAGTINVSVGYLAFASVASSAQSGTIRLPSTSVIAWRNNGGSADLLGMMSTANDDIQLGSSTQPVTIPYTKTTTGDPTGREGMHCINTSDNNYKVYADGGWRTLASGW